PAGTASPTAPDRRAAAGAPRRRRGAGRSPTAGGRAIARRRLGRTNPRSRGGATGAPARLSRWSTAGAPLAGGDRPGRRPRNRGTADAAGWDAIATRGGTGPR